MLISLLFLNTIVILQQIMGFYTVSALFKHMLYICFILLNNGVFFFNLRNRPFILLLLEEDVKKNILVLYLKQS